MTKQQAINEAFYKYFVLTYAGGEDSDLLADLDAQSYDYTKLGRLLMLNSAAELTDLAGVTDFAGRLAGRGHQVDLEIIPGHGHAMDYGPGLSPGKHDLSQLCPQSENRKRITMINIEKFIKIRKSLKLSQNELCNGICTQSTLSKFENNGQIPSFKILKQLCERMNISLSDIMLTSTESEIAQKLFSADFYFITYDYDQVRKILKQVNEKKIRDKQDLLHYNYLCGQLALDGDHNDVSALFYFNNILTTDNLKADNIYRLLALKAAARFTPARTWTRPLTTLTRSWARSRKSKLRTA